MADSVPAVVWMLMPLLIAAGAALISGALMQARLEVAVARQREVLAEARALLATQHRMMEERVRAAEESARRKALDEFMSDIRVEQRQLLRESHSLISRNRRPVLQERVCFRCIPLTGWVDSAAGTVVASDTLSAEIDPAERSLVAANPRG